jgi:hypothetical protein
MELGIRRRSKPLGVKLMAHGFQSDPAACKLREACVGRVPVRTVKEGGDEPWSVFRVTLVASRRGSAALLNASQIF